MSNQKRGLRKVAFLILWTCIGISAEAQQHTNQDIIINGIIKSDKSEEGLSQIMIVNKRKGNGIFAQSNGQFKISMHKTDTLLITALGYKTKKISFKDSTLKNEYFINITLDKLQIQLKEVEIFPQRDLSEIEKDIQKLHYDKNDYMLSGINSYTSPITFLYQEFSRKERSKRLAAELRYEDKKRELLKELLTKYVNGNIIKLSTEQFDEFIQFANVSEEFMKSSTQYEFIMFIKFRYEKYVEVKKYRIK